jgi:excisionase family DNA binding protein
VQLTTVQQWCRQGRLPCLKVGKAWRVRETALSAFLEAAEAHPTLVDHLRAFLTVPDQVIALADDVDLLTRLDAAFFQLGAASGATLVKFAGGETRSIPELRDDLARAGLAVTALEAAGRLHWSPLVNPGDLGDAALAPLAVAAELGQALWISFDWTRPVALATLLKQQASVTARLPMTPVVIKTAAVAAAAEAPPMAWSATALTEAFGSVTTPRGLIRIGHAGLVFSRAVPLPRQERRG